MVCTQIPPVGTHHLCGRSLESGHGHCPKQDYGGLSLPNLPKLLGLPADRGWRRAKGSIGVLKCHRTSLHRYGLPSSCPACRHLPKEPAPEEGAHHCSASLPGNMTLPTEGT